MKMLKLKNSYDKQELLRKMRTDMKREYLTRKKQVTRLQKDAAIDFRNAESSLQEHYATEAADHSPYIRQVDINAPLVSQIQLPDGKHFDLKTFNENHEFARVRQIHEDLRRDQEEQEQRRFEEQEQSRWWGAEAEALAKWEQRQYLERSAYETRRVVELRNEVQENTEGDMPQLCLEESCHDSDYCGPFGYYPRGEVPRERHEAGLASIRRRAQAEQQQEEEQVGCYGDGGFCCCGDLECSDCFSYGSQNDDQSSYNSEYDYPREYNYERECREAEEAEAAAAAAAAEEAAQAAAEQQVMDDDTSYQCDDYPDVVQVTEPRERITVAAAGGAISAKTKAKSKTNAAAAAKARIAKKQQNKFAPITVTINTNRVSVEDAESSSTMLYKGKVQINLPKKNMQASSASREDKKRHDEKWRRINAAQKQSSARGTGIANIPQPRMWYDEPNDSD